MSANHKDAVQGEGDYESAKRVNEDKRRFVEEGKVEEAAEKAGEQSEAEGRAAEEAARERAKEVDPEVKRDYDKPTGA